MLKMLNDDLTKRIIAAEEAFWKKHQSLLTGTMRRVTRIEAEIYLIEWLTDNLRIGISVDNNPSWYIVSDCSLGDVQASGSFTGVDVEAITNWVLSFIPRVYNASNTTKALELLHAWLLDPENDASNWEAIEQDLKQYPFTLRDLDDGSEEA